MDFPLELYFLYTNITKQTTCIFWANTKVPHFSAVLLSYNSTATFRRTFLRL